ncbi:MAG: hypothetical protein A2Y73_03955 [Chloroflexi bacterium RBG_13_56_8]|nr:MAG: hypothetical protein A2Y73_03955 [Chloroflexi bacterium RBG_13_56_8]
MMFLLLVFSRCSFDGVVEHTYRGALVVQMPMATDLGFSAHKMCHNIIGGIFYPVKDRGAWATLLRHVELDSRMMAVWVSFCCDLMKRLANTGLIGG